jgi:uncharacterized protein (TIGR00297 family)
LRPPSSGKKKQVFEVSEETKKGRTVFQVLANAGVPGIIGVIMIWHPDYHDMLFPAMAAALASASADTLSSELGMVYGRRFFNILTFRSDYCGLDGVVSIEGTLFGIGGSCIIAGINSLVSGWDIDFVLIVLAGTIGNLLDSVLGALLERKGIIGNDVVNFLNTLVAALTILGLRWVF